MLGRRRFLETIGCASGALVIGVHLPGCRTPAGPAGPFRPASLAGTQGHHRIVLEDGTELRMSRYQREVAKRLGLA